MKVTVTTPSAVWVLELNDATETVAVVSRTQNEQSMFAKAASWAAAEASLLTQGPLPDEQYEARIAACRSCEHLEAKEEPLVGFCKACGCGRNARAELTVKGRMPAATCPKGKWPAHTA